MFWTVVTTDDGVDASIDDVPSIEPGAFGVESVAVAGGCIDVNVLDPALPFAIRLHSPEIASLWLAFVVGEEVTEGIFSSTAGSTSYPSSDQNHHLADVARRFALGTWMRRWWTPANWIARSRQTPSEVLLDAELAALAYSGSSLFATYGVTDMFLHHAIPELRTELEIRTNSHWLHSDSAELIPHAVENDRVLSVLAAAASACLDRDLLSGKDLDELLAAETRYWDMREGVAAKGETLADVLSPTRVLEPWALTMSGFEQQRTIPIDPVEVHPRSIRTTHFTLSRSDATLRIDIESPEPGSVPIDLGELYARVEFGDETYAIALRPTPEGFTGERELQGSLDHSLKDIRASIFSDRYSTGGRRGRTEDLVKETRAALQSFADARESVTATISDARSPYEDPAAPFAIEVAYLEA